jgi:ribosomal protein S18 acetylase RimI-like enzyme
MYAHISESQGVSGVRRALLLRGLGVSLAAVGFVYAAHHLGPLQGHAIDSVLVAIAATAVLTSFVTRGSIGVRSEPEPLLLTATSPMVRAGRSADLAFCAALHAKALPHGLFASLGDRFMRAYYETYATSPYGVLLIAEASGVAIGFVAGATDPASHKRWLVRHRALRLALRGSASLCTRPVTAFRFLRTRAAAYLSAMRRGRSAPAEPGSLSPDSPAHLAHVAVLAGARGLGGGQALVHAFEAETESRGASCVHLTTLSGSAGAGEFYAKLGWQRLEAGLGFGGERFDLWANQGGAS